MDIVFFGIRGSGKGTQAKKLVQEFGYRLFEAGAELRTIAASGTALGKTVKDYIDHGKLVPHGIIMEVVREAMDAAPADTVFVFDGVPRDMDQLRDFEELMRVAGRTFRCVMLFVDGQAAVERIVKRAKLEGRVDDADEDIVRKRMHLYREKTMPVIDACRDKGLVVEVEGEGEVDEVYGRVKTGLGVGK